MVPTDPCECHEVAYLILGVIYTLVALGVLFTVWGIKRGEQERLRRRQGLSEEEQ